MSSADPSSTKTVQDVINRIVELFEARGNELYGGEAVSQTEHALQAALAAEKEGAGAELITAALLHDLGHLLHNLPEDCAEQGIDDRHEDLAYRWLTRYFGPAVTEPIRLHVAAKRYLCAVKPGYHDELSDASKLSLSIQGGPFSPTEVAEFDKNPFCDPAIRVRYWDDIAKIKDLPTPDLQYYRRFMEEAAGSAT